MDFPRGPLYSVKMRRTLRQALPLAALCALLGLPHARAADTVAPLATDFGITDCEGVMQFNSVLTSTRLATVQIRAFDHDGSSNATRTGMGLRFGRVAHVGGTAAAASNISHLHFDDGVAPGGTTASTATAGGSTAVNGGLVLGTVAACTAGQGHTGLASDLCYNWTGATDRIEIPATPTLNSTTVQLTLQAWIRPTDAASRPLFEFGSVAPVGPHFWQGFGTGNGDLYANLVDTNNVSHVVASTAGFVKANDWQLVTMTYNGSLAKLYHNHVEIASRTFPSMPPLKVNTSLFIGRRPSAGNVFSGRIDEVRVLRRALTGEEVEGDFFGGQFLLKRSVLDSVAFTPLPLDNTHLDPDAPAAANPPTPGVAATTATVTNVVFASGANNTLVFNFQDLVGNTQRVTFGINAVESVPDIPLNLSAGGITTSGINWSWTRGTRLCLTAAGGVGQFVGRRADTGAIVYPANTTAAFNEGGLSANTLYGLQVQASDAFGLSPLSAAASAYTLAAAPTGFGASSISTGSAVLSWSSTNPNYTRFEVSISPDAFATTVSTPVTIESNLTALTTSFVGLVPETLYSVRVRAFNGRASDSTTAGSAFTAALTGTFTTLPNPPGTLSGTALSATAINWTWTTVPTATSYTLESSTGTNLAVTAATSHAVTNLSPNAAYGARLRANNAGGSGNFGAVVNTFTNAQPPAGTAAAAVTTSTVRFTWGGNGNPAGTSYQLQVATLTGFGTVLSAVSVTQNEATVTGLLPASTYYARVRASGFNGNLSAFDTAITFVTGSFGAISSTSAPPSPYAVSGPEVGVYHFDEAGGTRAADSSGHANHLALTGSLTISSPTFVTGQTGLGSALRFPGLLESVAQAPHSASLAGTGDLTVQFWANPAASVQVADAGVVVKGTGTEETFIFDVSGGTRWRFGVRDAAGTFSSVTSTQALTPNAWVHVAGVYKSGGSPSLSVYVDGTLSATTGAAPAARRATANSLSIGNRRSGASSFDRAFRGDLDEVHIATVALTAAQVGADYASARPATLVPPSPNDQVRVIVPPNAFGAAAVILMSSSPLTVPISILPSVLSDGISAPPSGRTLVPGSVFEIVANVGGSAFNGQLGSTVTLGLPYPDADSNGLVDGTFPPIPVESLKMYTLNTAVTSWDALPSSVDTTNKRVLGQTTHFSVFALFGPTGIKPDTNQVRLYPRPWRPGSGGRFDSVTFGGRTGLAIDNLTSSGKVRIFTLSGELVREMTYGAVNVGTLIWDGANDSGTRTASGVYFALVIPDAGEEVVIKFAVER